MNLLMYGAGCIGRGFIAPLFSAAGYNVIFVDIDRDIIDALNSCDEYSYTIAAQPAYREYVSKFSIIDGNDTKLVIKEIANCDIMATALGAANLQTVSPIIAQGLALRRQYNRPLDILICENLKNSSDRLRKWITDALPEADLGIYGLVKTAIGRTVTPQNGDKLNLLAEKYAYLPADKTAFTVKIPDICTLVPYSPIEFYEERKLYLHNMGHAVCAYLGLAQGHEYIWQAIADPYVRIVVQNAMIESCCCISKRYDEPFHNIYNHAEDLLLRFANKTLGDTCERVGRDTMRKLSPDDRLIGIINLCYKYGISPAYISLGAAAALMNITANADAARKIAAEHCQLPAAQANMVMELYNILTDENGLQKALNHAELLKSELRSKNV